MHVVLLVLIVVTLGSTIFLYAIPYGIYTAFLEPRKLTILIKENGGLFIRYKHIHTTHVMLAILWMIIWFITLFLNPNSSAADGMFGVTTGVLLSLIVLTILFGYFIFAGFRNETAMYIRSNREVVSAHGPLPPTFVPLHLANVVSVDYKKNNRVFYRIPSLSTFSIRVTDATGNSGVLCNIVNNESHAKLIVSQIEACLAKADKSTESLPQSLELSTKL